jgi:predicted nucleotidyltransferase
MSIIATIRGYLDHQEEILLTFMVGIRSGTHAMPESDYDLVILTGQVLMPARRMQIEQELVRLLDADMVVLVPLNHETPRRLYAIVVHGRVIFERDLTERIMFEEELVQTYVVCHTPELSQEDTTGSAQRKRVSSR